MALPQLGIRKIKAKVDSGARTSALHAQDIHYFHRDGMEMVRFKIHPLQKKKIPEIHAEAEVVDRRMVKSSTGHMTERPVVLTTLKIGKQQWSIEITLIDRDLMGFRFLIGRQAIGNRFWIDPHESYLVKSKKRKKKKVI